jgi:nitrate/nitrite transporter NarK
MHVTGTITGWFLVGGSLGGMILPVLIGQAFDRFGPTSMIMIVFVTILLNLAALVLFTRVSAKAPVTGDKIPAEI